MFGRKKAIYEDPDALAEFTRYQEQLREKKRQEAEERKKREEEEKKQFEQDIAIIEAKEAARKKDLAAQKKFQEEELDRLIASYSKKKPFKPFWIIKCRMKRKEQGRDVRVMDISLLRSIWNEKFI